MYEDFTSLHFIKTSFRSVSRNFNFFLVLDRQSPNARVVAYMIPYEETKLFFSNIR